MIQLGIAAFFHDSSACLVKNGKVIAAVEEERFTEIKHDYSFPYNSINWLLENNNLKLNDIDEVCWYENPKIKKDRVLSIFNKRWLKTLPLRFNYLISYRKNNPSKILKKLGYKGPIKYTDHHLSHAAFSYFTSPFNEAAILTVDGVGEWETITISSARGNNIDKKFNIDYPNSLGMLYSTITAYLGFKPNEGEYKVMGLAPYGNPEKYIPKLREIFDNTSDKFIIKQKYFDWEYSDKKMFNKHLFKLLGILPRLPEEKVMQEHKDLAAALQVIYEEQFLKLVKLASKLVKSKNLVLGGGCAYNGVANSKAYKFFKHIHIPYAPSDAGSAIGTCLTHYKGNKKDNTNPFLGPQYNDKEIKKELIKFPNLKYYKLSEEEIIKKTASLINSGNIIAWFQGKMEFGARALGNRSILATPLDAEMRTKLNYVIKKREGFRPFAPSVLKGEDSKWFKVKENIPYMNQVVKAKNKAKFPSATHVDGSCRVHTVTLKQNHKYLHPT